MGLKDKMLLLEIEEVVATVSAILLIIAVFLPWGSSANASILGIDGKDSIITIGIGLLALALLLIKNVSNVIPLFLGLLALAVGGYDFYKMNIITGTLHGEVGIGLYLTIVASVGVVIGSTIDIIRKRKRSKLVVHAAHGGGFKALTWFLLFTFIFSGFSGWPMPNIALAFDGGAGTLGDPYQISTCVQLQSIGNSASSYYILTADVDCTIDTHSGGALYNSGAGFAPLLSFAGNFNGSGHTVTGLYVYRPSSNYIGLFGSVGSGTVTNVGMRSVDLTGHNMVGGLVGYSYQGSGMGTVKNSYTTGTVTGVGGAPYGFDGVGGVIGYSENITTDCYSRATVVKGSVNNAGGAIGWENGGYTRRVYSTGAVSSGGGGLINANLGTSLENGFWDTETSGRSSSGGGGTGKTTAEMKSVITYTSITTGLVDPVWDFVGNPGDDVLNNNYWDIAADRNNGYPYLVALMPPVDDFSSPTIAPADIVVNNSVQPNTVALTFNEALEPVQAAIAGNYVLKNNGETITYSIASAALSNGNATVTLTLNTVDPMNPPTFITNADVAAGIKVTPSAVNIKDVALNVYAGGMITANGASNPPELIDSTAAAVNPALTRLTSTTYTVTFGEKLNETTAETLNKYALSGTCAASTGNPSVAALQANGVDVILTIPDTSGCNNGIQTVIVTPAGTITDVAGVSITSSAATVILDDFVAPTISTYSPTDDSIAVSSTTNLVATFDEDVEAVAAKYVDIMNGEVLVEHIEATDAKIIIAGAVVTINPATNLDSETEFHVLIEAGAFVDVSSSNNPFAGILTPAMTWSFTTIDSVAPVNTGGWPLVDPITGTGFTLEEKTNETGNAYYVVVADGATAPSSAQVKLGNNASDVAAIASGSFALTADTVATVAVSGLISQTAYDVYVVAEDEIPNLQAAPVKVDVTTLDITAPTNTGGWPVVDTATGIGFTVREQINEVGTAYYVVVADGAAAPSSAQVKLGNNASDVAALASGSFALVADVEGTAVVSSLVSQTAYDVYVVAEDGIPNLQVSPRAMDITTTDVTAPANVSGWPKADTATGVGFTVRGKTNEAATAYYVVVANGATAPSSAQVRAGDDALNADALVSGSFALTADTEGTAVVSSLLSETQYDVYVVAEDGLLNLQESPVGRDVTTADVTAPTNTLGWPTVNIITSTGFTVREQINEVGTAYYVVVANGAAAPTSAQVRAGDDALNADALANGSFALVADTEGTAIVSTLSSQTAYDVYVVAQDATSNLQAAPVNVDVTTLDVTAPVMNTLYPLDEATGVSPVTNLNITFGELVTAGVNKHIVVMQGGFPIETISTDDVSKVSIDGGTNVVTVNLTSLLDYSDSFTLLVDEGAFLDVSLNPSAELVDGTWNFTVATPTAITTCVQLQAMTSSLTGHYILSADIDCQTDTHEGGSLWNGGLGFESIGSAGPGVPFTGTLNGGGYKIKNLFINRPLVSSVGVFGETNTGAAILNVGVEGVNITGDSFVGGLVGNNVDGEISDSYSTGSVTAVGMNAGGLIGYTDGGVIAESYSDATVIGNSGVGGFIAFNNAGTISNSYATGSVTGTLGNAGGFVGLNDVGGLISNSYSTGAVAGVVEGGFGGENLGTIDDSFWDVDTSGLIVGAGGIAKTTLQMKTESTFTDAAWGFDSVWNISAVVNNGYPFLRWVTIPTVQFTATSSSAAESVAAVTLPLILSTTFMSDVTVDYTVTGGTATGSGTDYTLAAGTATIAAGQTTANISLTIIDDSAVEDNETILVTISTPINSTLGVNTVYTYTITNDDVAVVVSSGGGGGGSSSYSSSNEGDNDSNSSDDSNNQADTVVVTPPFEVAVIESDVVFEQNEQQVAVAEKVVLEKAASSVTALVTEKVVDDKTQVVSDSEFLTALSTYAQDVGQENVITQNIVEPTIQMDQPTADVLSGKVTDPVIVEKVEAAVTANAQNSIVQALQDFQAGSGSNAPLLVNVAGKEQKITNSTEIKFSLSLNDAEALRAEYAFEGKDVLVLDTSSDVDRDGVADYVQIQNEQPLFKPDSDEDGFSNRDEYFFAGDPKKADLFESLVPVNPKITNLHNKKSNVVASTSMLWIAGQGIRDKLSIYIVDVNDSNKKTIIASGEIDSQFKAAIPVEFPAGEYFLFVKSESGIGEVQRIKVDPDLELKAPAFAVDSGLPKLASAGTLKADESLILDQNGLINGTAKPGEIIYITWNSVVLNSVVVADASSGSFQVQVPSDLPDGQHAALAYVINGQNPWLSDISKMLFGKQTVN